MTLSLTDFPPIAGCGYVYAIAFSNGSVKVGSTADPETRIKTHRENAKAFEIQIVDLWLTDAHVNYLLSEQIALGIARSRSTKVLRKENFAGIDFKSMTSWFDELGLGREYWS